MTRLDELISDNPAIKLGLKARSIWNKLHFFSDKESSGFASPFIKTPEGWEHHYKVKGQHVNVLFTRKYKNQKHYDVDFMVNGSFSRPLIPKFDPVVGTKILWSVRQSIHNFKHFHEPHSYHFEAFDKNPFLQHFKQYIYQAAAQRIGAKHGARVRHLPTKSVIHFKEYPRKRRRVRYDEMVEPRKTKDYIGYGERFHSQGHNIHIIYDKVAHQEHGHSYHVNFQVDNKWKIRSTLGDPVKRLFILRDVMHRMKQFIHEKKPVFLTFMGNADEKNEMYSHMAEHIAKHYPGSQPFHFKEGSFVHFPQHINSHNVTLTTKE